MAIYTTFFLCTPGELLLGFPDWRLPLPQPVRRERRNPFTGELIIVESREPEWPGDSDLEPPRNYQVATIEGRYEDYLERRLPEFVRACAHWAAKGLTEATVGPLLKAASVDGSWEFAIYSPPSSDATLQELPLQVFHISSPINQESEILAPIAALAHKATAGQRMYLLTEA